MHRPLTRLLSTTVSALALALPFGLLSGCSQAADTPLDQPLSAAVMKKLETASTAGLGIEEMPLYTSFQAIHGPNPGTSDKKAGVLYIGADFCPYCAALRWPLAIALMRFGTLSGLQTMRSSPDDVYPDTTTLTFVKAKFVSHYVHFQQVETADRHGKPLEPLVGQAAELFRKFDAPPYSSQAGGIPFVYIGGRWLLLGSPVNPKDYGKKPWSKIADELANPNSKLAKAVLPQANLITAAICNATGGKPAKICKAPAIVTTAALLPPR